VMLAAGGPPFHVYQPVCRYEAGAERYSVYDAEVLKRGTSWYLRREFVVLSLSPISSSFGNRFVKTQSFNRTNYPLQSPVQPSPDQPPNIITMSSSALLNLTSLLALSTSIHVAPSTTTPDHEDPTAILAILAAHDSPANTTSPTSLTTREAT
jgi:hypothetical protein